MDTTWHSLSPTTNLHIGSNNRGVGGGTRRSLQSPHNLSTLTTITLILLLLVATNIAPTDASFMRDSCQTLTTEIRVTKDKTYEYNGRRKRLFCTGEVLMNKCEGSCMSMVSPSVVHFPGFKKDCKCCRESRLIDKMVTLTECYDGSSLVSNQFVRFFVKNPVECKCFDCAI